MGRLPATFSFDDVMADLTTEEIGPAVSRLYDAIEGGQVIPEQSGRTLRYRSVAPSADSSSAQLVR